tara:strand:- start:154 stop:747 length:594 start_codon:yes stop_codon:yes gene_type:complete
MLEFKTQFTELFTTPVWQTQITGIDNDQIKKYCLDLRTKYPGIQISNRGGWHSKELDVPLPNALDELIHDLTAYINQFVGQHTKTTDLILGNWWININGKGDYNAEHDHQNAILSAVYYVDVKSSDTGNLIIHREDASRYYLGKYKKTSTNFSEQSFIISPETSKLAIFPAWVKHSVEQNKSDTERITIAFNFVEPE